MPFVADIERLRLAVDPMTGEEIDALIKEIYSAPRALIEQAKHALKP